jgi:hypothetical protein
VGKKNGQSQLTDAEPSEQIQGSFQTRSRKRWLPFRCGTRVYHLPNLCEAGKRPYQPIQTMTRMENRPCAVASLCCPSSLVYEPRLGCLQNNRVPFQIPRMKDKVNPKYGGMDVGLSRTFE